MKKTILISLISFFSMAAFADQCAYITKPQAKKAVRALIGAKKVQSLCEPCGDTSPENIEIDSLSFRKTGYEKTSEVVINDKAVDIAYIYVNGFNLANIVGCPVHDVSLKIK